MSHEDKFQLGNGHEIQNLMTVSMENLQGPFLCHFCVTFFPRDICDANIKIIFSCYIHSFIILLFLYFHNQYLLFTENIYKYKGCSLAEQDSLL